MFTLKQWWKLVMDSEPHDNWDGKVLCTESDTAMTLRTNVTQGYLACYTFTLVTDGWLTMRIDDRELKINRGDLYIYSPGMAVTVTDISTDYRSLCLIVDEFTTLESPSAHDMVSLAFMPTGYASPATTSHASSNASRGAP